MGSSGLIATQALYMKVLFIQKYAGTGGSKSSLLETLDALDAHTDVETEVLLSETGVFTQALDERSVSYHLATLPEWRKLLERLQFRGHLRRAVKELKAGAYDWVVSNEMWWGPHAIALAKGLGARSAVIIRDGIATPEKALKYHLDRADLVLPCSADITRRLRIEPRLAGSTRTLFDPIRIGSSGAPIPEIPKRLRECPEVKRWLVVVGKYSERKNQVDVVRTLARLDQFGERDLGVAFIGGGSEEYSALLRAEAGKLGLSKRVLLIDHTPDVRSHVLAATAVVLTSRREGLPRSLVEALLLGVPAYSYACEGVTDIFPENVIARFVAADNQVDTLARLMNSGLAEVRAGDELMLGLQQRMEQMFSLPAHARNFVESLGSVR